MPAKKNTNRTVTMTLEKVDKSNGAVYFVRDDMNLRFWAPRSNFKGGEKGIQAMKEFIGQKIAISEVSGSTLRLATLEDRTRYAHAEKADLQKKIEVLRAQLDAMVQEEQNG